MIIGVTLLKMAGASYYSPQFGRGGLAATFAVEVTNWVGGGTTPELNVVVEHRNQEDTSWTTAVTFSPVVDADGIYSESGSTLKEILRFKFTFTGGVATTGAHLNVLAPQWRPY